MKGSMAEVIAAVRAAIDAYTRRQGDLQQSADATRQVLTWHRWKAEEAAVKRPRCRLRPPQNRLRLSGLPVCPGREHPDAVAALKRVGWPKNSEGNISARAILYDRHGNKVGTRAYRADDKNHPSTWPDLKDGWNNPELTTTWHAEGQLARDIRKSGLDEATVYMTTFDDDLFPVQGTEEQLAELLHLADEIDSDELAKCAMGMGINPPLEGYDYWEIVLTFPDSTNQPDKAELAWLGPDTSGQGDSQ